MYDEVPTLIIINSTIIFLPQKILLIYCSLHLLDVYKYYCELIWKLGGGEEGRTDGHVHLSTYTNKYIHMSKIY